MVMLEPELVATARVRAGSRVKPAWADPPADPSIRELAEALEPSAGRVWLTGGEPTLRADLPELVGALAARGHRPGLVSDALALTSEGALDSLVSAGLSAVRVVLHAARPDAHDWLVGMPGAAKRAVRALGRLRARGLELELAATVTRPTMPLLAELVEAAASLGARKVHLHRLVLAGRALEEVVALAPRHALLAPYLEAAVRAGERVGVAVVLRGFPECETGTVSERRASGDPFPTVTGCARCPGPPRCAGMPADYVRCFGRSELFPSPPSAPPERLRVRFRAPSRVACPECGDRGGDAVPETTRAARARLVRAAQQGARTLRVVSASSLNHPEAAALLRECSLLSFERVEVAGEASGLDRATDAALYALSGISRFDLALYGPDADSHDAHVGVPGAFAAALRVGERIARLAKVPVGSYAVLHDESLVEAFARAWSEGRLPGTPRFRLSARGGSLDALGRLALPTPARAALERALTAPLAAPSELAFEDELEPGLSRSGSDPEGEFERGHPRGWRLDAAERA
jgi:MoaA/NifB/PqqE/SkfB family radical SAM enzyme